jgi:hypothetical protein
MSPRKLPELPENVLRIRPDVVVKRAVGRPRRVKSGTPPDLRSVTPSEIPTGPLTTTLKGKKRKRASSLTMTPASLQLPVPEGVSSSVLNPKQLKAEFRKAVLSMGKTELRKRYPLEAASYGDMKGRVRTHGAVIHPAFAEFRDFLLHVGPRPIPTWTLDRLNPHDPEYAPKKVAWRDKRSQSNNRRNTILLTVGGETRPLTDWARLTDQDPKTLRKRLERGLSHEEVVYGRKKHAPEPEAEPVEPVETEGYVWPGSQPDRWEYGYQGFVTVVRRHAYLRLYPASAFTRDVFLAWIAGNVLAETRRALRERYPGFDEPDGDPDYENPPEALADPVYRRIEVLEQPHDQAMRRVRGDRAAYDLWLHTLRHYSAVTRLPQDWAHLFRNLRRPVA